MPRALQTVVLKSATGTLGASMVTWMHFTELNRGTAQRNPFLCDSGRALLPKAVGPGKLFLLKFRFPEID